MLTKRVLNLKGDALDNLAVAKFVALLRDAATFEKVELKSSLEKASRDVRVHSFSIECVY